MFMKIWLKMQVCWGVGWRIANILILESSLFNGGGRWDALASAFREYRTLGVFRVAVAEASLIDCRGLYLQRLLLKQRGSTVAVADIHQAQTVDTRTSGVTHLLHQLVE